MKTKINETKIYKGREKALSAALKEFEKEAKLFLKGKKDFFFIQVGMAGTKKPKWWIK